MRRVAFLTASCVIDGHPDAREDAWEHALELAALRPACKHRMLALDEVIWDDPDFAPSEYEAIVVGTCWDYMQKPDQFLSRMDEFSRESRLFNPYATLRWNSDKAYLADLAKQGVPTIETIWADQATPEAIAAAFSELGTDRVVVKPRIGASAWRQSALRKGDALPEADALPPDACLIQPFLSAAETEGELTLLFFDRLFSHGLIKTPKAGDYRTQSLYGATEKPADPPADALRVAHAALEAVEGELLYSRVDLMRGEDGGWKIMELELIEPYLYPEQGPFTGPHFAAALDRLLAKTN